MKGLAHITLAAAAAASHLVGAQEISSLTTACVDIQSKISDGGLLNTIASKLFPTPPPEPVFVCGVFVCGACVSVLD